MCSREISSPIGYIPNTCARDHDNIYFSVEHGKFFIHLNFRKGEIRIQDLMKMRSFIDEYLQECKFISSSEFCVDT